MGREYVDTIRANKATLKKMEKVQFAIFKRLNNDYDNDDLNKAFNAISGISTILGLICKIHPAVNAVTVIAGVCGSLRKGEQESLARMVRNGFIYIRDELNFMEENTQFDMVELKLPYLDYSTNSGEISFISGYGIQTGLHPRNGGGWMMAS